jgi:hypothetical protein
VAQFSWLVVVPLVTGLQVINLPALYRQLFTVCIAPIAVCEEAAQLLPEQAQDIVAAGMTLAQYAALTVNLTPMGHAAND